MKIILKKKYGYGPNCYIVAKLAEFYEIVSWMYENNVDHWHVSSGPEGYGFQVKSNVEWFNLKWL